MAPFELALIQRITITSNIFVLYGERSLVEQTLALVFG